MALACFVEYHGVRIIDGWREKIREAQLRTAYVIDGLPVERVRYGSETHDWGVGPRRQCHDCGVINGEFHVPSCDVEECPRCHGQVLSCDCPYDASERSWEP
jgi:hypothetical protein